MLETGRYHGQGTCCGCAGGLNPMEGIKLTCRLNLSLATAMPQHVRYTLLSLREVMVSIGAFVLLAATLMGLAYG